MREPAYVVTTYPSCRDQADQERARSCAELHSARPSLGQTSVVMGGCIYVKFRSAMLRNSSAKSSSVAEHSFTRCAKWL